MLFCRIIDSPYLHLRHHSWRCHYSRVHFAHMVAVEETPAKIRYSILLWHDIYAVCLYHRLYLTHRCISCNIYHICLILTVLMPSALIWMRAKPHFSLILAQAQIPTLRNAVSVSRDCGKSRAYLVMSIVSDGWQASLWLKSLAAWARSLLHCIAAGVWRYLIGWLVLYWDVLDAPYTVPWDGCSRRDHV